MGKCNTKMTIARKLRLYFCNRSIILILVREDKIAIMICIAGKKINNFRTSFDLSKTNTLFKMTMNDLKSLGIPMQMSIHNPVKKMR